MDKAKILLIGFATATLAFTEFLFALGESAYGILAALAITFVLYALISIVRAKVAVVEVMEVISLLFIYVLLISSLPWFFIRQELIFPAVYFILIGLCVWYIKDANLTLRDVGLWLPRLKRAHSGYRGVPAKEAKIRLNRDSLCVRAIIVSFIVGLLTGAIEFLILKPQPPLPAPTVGYLLQTMLSIGVLVGVGEELLFRGILLTRLEKVLDPRLALIVSSIAFAILHFTWRLVSEVVFVFFTSLLLGFIFQRTRNLLPPIILHATNNIVLVAILPFL